MSDDVRWDCGCPVTTREDMRAAWARGLCGRCLTEKLSHPFAAVCAKCRAAVLARREREIAH